MEEIQERRRQFHSPVPGRTTRQRQQCRRRHEITHIAGPEKGVIYTVVWASMDAAQTVDEANFQIFKNSFLSKLPKCEVGTEQPASPTLQGYIGHGYRLNCEAPQAKMAITGNLYWGKHYCFALLAIFASEEGEPAEMKSFIESFAIIDPIK